ncbi:MAG: hypothetical protein IT384_33030 [Deltaproteobacteria bacterium]|nr:hypothetical protein [Deltaproteobacteria bacterium]
MVDPQQLRDELKRIRALINERPDVRARFDKDGNGVIDGEEWEEVRQLVIKRLERKAAEAAAAGPAAGAPEPEPLAEEVVGEIATRAARAAVSGAVGDLDELVVRREGSLVAQMAESLVRRSYAVLAPSGRVAATIQQRENEAIQALGNRALLEIPELNFSVHDVINGEQLTLTRRTSGLNFRIDASDARGLLIGYAQGKTALLRSEYQVGATLLAHPFRLLQPILRPFTLELTDAFDEPKGEIQRQWSGFGSFLTGSNQMHLTLRPGAATRELRWALVAAMVLIDLAAEKKD